MVLLDTNVITELVRPRPDPAVQAWMRAQPIDRCVLASVTVAEVLYGLALMPDGERRKQRTARLGGFIDNFRILTFGRRGAVHYAGIAAARRAAGTPIGAFDALIAATALEHGTAIAIRDAGGFAGCGTEIIDPWSGP